MDQKRCLRAVLLFLASFAVAQGYRMFADRLPNGNQVPHPCKPNVLWHGVGHFNVDGGGARNPFGQDFDLGGRQWTVALCRQDSDGDGRTNGQELGDPECVWRVGDIPHTTQGLSHPGICDPIDSATCKHKQFHIGLFHDQAEWMADACKSVDFNCSGIHDSGVAPRAAYECDMMPDRQCKVILTGWILGLTGDCFHPNAGVRIGKNGLKRLVIQLHWNNPGRVEHYVDSSGLVLHYTPILRQYDSSVLLLGNTHFSIPPRTASTIVTSTCNGDCTQAMMTQTIHVSAGFNHMHYLGHKMRVDQYRNGTKVRTILDDPVYSYDSPVMHFFQDPIPIHVGDELRTVCEYTSTYKTSTTWYGESTGEEMCYAFLRFYPFEAFNSAPRCTTYATLSECSPATYHGCIGEMQDKYFRDISGQQIFHNVTGSCRPFGPCTTECMETILAARQADPCLTSGDAWDRIVEWGLSTNAVGKDFLASLESCEIELYQLDNPADVIGPH